MVENNKMTDDKYILLGLNDERSKDVADVLGNKTCRKILDFLSETNEASEKDISDALGIPLNTAEYNLNKLKKSGLIVSSKNFFWSKKGKKIPMYKLAKKHIIISPSKKPNLTALKAILPILLLIVAVLFLILLIPQFGKEPGTGVDEGLKQFTSMTELKEFIQENAESGEYFGYNGIRMVEGTVSMDSAKSEAAPQAASNEEAGGASDYSTTNIQVEGVDEADIVKNDGKYIYAVTGSKITIVNAYPAENMKIASEINLTNNVGEIFINDDKLIVFSSGYISYEKSGTIERYAPEYEKYASLVYVYDVSDRENPELEDEYEIEGSYVNSRMIGDYVYVISNKYINTNNPEPPVYRINGIEETVAVEDVYYWDYPDTGYVFTSILSINVEEGDYNSEVYLTGYSGAIYVSQDNIYLTRNKYIRYEDKFKRQVEEVYYKVLPESEIDKIKDIMASDVSNRIKIREVSEVVEDYSASLTGNDLEDFSKKLMDALEDFQIEISKEEEKTIISKISINKDEINYEGVGEVPGRVLNQFSMDEYNGYFRIATTTGNTWGGTSLNHLYVLNEELEVVGKVEDLARGEQIYSARFMGERAYMVTFRQVDPFYVIDISDPENPEVLGYLKIPGYSSYLHPYDENHVIGIGKEDNRLKISLFDVTNVKSPTEVGKYTVGGDYSDSTALYEHKAFLFNKEKELLVVPVSYSERGEYVRNQWGGYYEYKYWQGAFVFKVNLEGFDLLGKIEHLDNESQEVYYYSPSAVLRSLYMDDVLYTISYAKIKANNLETLDEISEVEIGYEYYYPLYGRGIAEPAVDVSAVAID